MNRFITALLLLSSIAYGSSVPSGKTSLKEISGLGLTTSIGSNLLTVSVKNQDLSANANGNNSITIGYRSSVGTTGSYTSSKVASSLSISTVAIGASFGLQSGVAQVIYVYAINYQGTIELALSSSASFDEDQTWSTTAIGAGSNSRGILYSTTARTGATVRLIGSVTVNEVTAGTYALAPTAISVLNQAPAPRSEVFLSTGNGFGATNSNVRRYSNVRINTGNAIQCVDSSTLGETCTIRENGIYSVNVTDADCIMTPSLNSATLNSTPDVLTIIGYQATRGGDVGTVSIVMNFSTGDVIRSQYIAGNLGTGTTDANSQLHITKVSN